MKHGILRGRGRIRVAVVVCMVAAFLMVVPASSFAGRTNPWQWTNPLPQGNQLNDVWALDANHVWAVGDCGTILFYDGRKVKRQKINAPNDLTGIYGIDENHIWASGDDGLVLFFNGRRWEAQATPTDGKLYDIDGFDANDVWAVGDEGTIIHFNGRDWREQPSDARLPLTSVTALDARHVWATPLIGDAIYFFDGHRWGRQSIGVFHFLYDISAADANHVWAVGFGGSRLLFFDGLQWNPERNPPPGDLFAVHAVAADEVYVAGARGIVASRDRRGRWSGTSVGEPGLLGISVLSNGRKGVFMVGAGGFFHRMDGNGSSRLDSGVNKDLSDIAFLGSDRAWAVGPDGTILSLSGPDWKVQASGTDRNLYGVAAADASHVWAVGARGTILFYDGRRWRAQASGTDRALFSVAAVDATHVWAVGARGTILFYDGRRWRAQESGTERNLYGVAAPDADHAWAVGDGPCLGGGNIFAYRGDRRNPGWTHQKRTDFAMRDVSARDANNVHAVGDHGRILSFNGRRWLERIDSGTTRDLLGVTCCGNSEVFVCGEFGMVFYFSENGVFCKADYSGTSNTLESICANSRGELVTAGRYGTILYKKH